MTSIDVTPSLTHYFDLAAEVALPPLDMGKTQHGRRVIFAITGGTFEGPYASGEVLPVGADWQLIREDGVAEIDVTAMLKTSDGVLIKTDSVGYRDQSPEVAEKFVRGEAVSPDEYYFRTTPRFEVPEGHYPELARRVFIGFGIRDKDGVRIRVFAVD